MSHGAGPGDGEAHRLHELADWLEGCLPADRTGPVRARITAADTDTTQWVRWLRGLYSVAGKLRDPPPPTVRAHLAEQFAAVMGPQGRRPARRALEAALVHDSRLDLALAGQRSTDAGTDVVHLAYASSVADMVVDVTALGGGLVRIDGQLLPVNPLEFLVTQLSGSGVKPRSVIGDADGRFSFDRVPAGTLTIEALAEGVTVIAEVDLGQGLVSR